MEEFSWGETFMQGHKWILPPRLGKYISEFVALYHSVYAKNNNPLPLLVMGQRGVGKSMFVEIFSHLFCEDKGCKLEDLLKPINIAAIPKELIESQLFGYKKGSFTGATRDFAGIVDTASKQKKGLLVLEEIGEISLETQAKLLTFIEADLPTQKISNIV